MEDVLAVYALPHDPLRPVVCMDESSKQLIGEVQAPIGPARGHGCLIDHEYVRNGVAEIFVEVEPLAGRRHVEITERRTRQDWARFVKGMLDERYPGAEKVRLVLDNLNTHFRKCFEDVLGVKVAHKLLRRVVFHYTPKHASWLNMAEIEIGILDRQCLNRRLPDRDTLASEVDAWQGRRNNERRRIEWMVSRQDADLKMARHYVS